MSTNVDIPSLGESVSEAVLIRWIKNDGDTVAKDDALAELETDKANVDLPAPAAGVLRHAKEAGETVHIGEVIARIDEAGSSAAAAPTAKPAAKPSSASAPSTAGNSSAPPAGGSGASSAAVLEDLSPAVRKLAEENKLDLSAVRGTGRDGRLTKEDVVAHLNARGGGQAATDDDDEQDTNGDAPPVAPAPAAPAKPKGAPAAVTSPKPLAPAPAAGATGPTAFDADGVKRVPMSKIRKRIAQTLVQAQNTAAILTTFNEVDLTTIMSLRAKYKERFNEVHGVGLGLMSFFARGVVLALKEFPRVNAEIDGDDIIYHNYVHLGVAVSTDRGLTVPILRHAETMSFAKIEAEIKRLAGAARDGKLGIQELSGGTFTITNGGVFGSLLSTPILLPPQSGILGMHTIQKRPMAIGDKIEIRPMMYVALSYDHRIVDGRESVSFLVRLKEYLEDPARLMLEV